MTKRKFPLWTLLGVVSVVALVIGSGALTSPPPTAAQRASAIESVVRCPSCEDLSVASSSAPTALTVRATVKQLIAEGRTDQQIKDYLAARYGTAIILEPPASGWSLLVWALPMGGGLIAGGAVATVLVRRRKVSDGEPTGDAGTDLLAPESVEERRRFLHQSLADADAEYLAGDLSDKDYLALRHRDMVRLAALDRHGTEVNAAGADRLPGDVLIAEPPSHALTDAPSLAQTLPSKRSRRSWWFLGGAVAAFGAALIVAVSLFASNRLPGQTPTGSVNLSQAQQVEQTLAQAATLENQGQLGQAAQLYQSVLNGHPDNEVALAQLGWLEYETGQSGTSASLISDARAKLNRAAQLNPNDYAVRLYLGTVILRQDGNAVGAVDQYRRFLADGPPSVLVSQAAPQIRQAYQRAGVPLPSQVPAA